MQWFAAAIEVLQPDAAALLKPCARSKHMSSVTGTADASLPKQLLPGNL
jgi:hypothetical protein